MSPFLSWLMGLTITSTVLLVPHVIRRLAEPQKLPVVQGSGKSIFRLINGYKQHIPDWNTFIGLGYGINDIKRMTDQELDVIPLGAAIDSIVEEKPFNPHEKCPCMSASHFEAINPTNHSKTLSLCFIKNPMSIELFSAHRIFSENGHYKLVESTLKENTTSCDVVIILQREILFNNRSFKYECPEECKPIPQVNIPLSWLSESPYIHFNTTVTCSLRFSDMLGTGSRLPQFVPPATAGRAAMPDSYIDALIKEISKRRVEECTEHHTWIKLGKLRGEHLHTVNSSHGHLHAHRHHSKHQHQHQHHSHLPLRRKVFGLIIWVGSTTRRSLLQSQIQVLRNMQNDTDSDSTSIVGWMATEDQYPCRLGSTLCENVSPEWHYFRLMPTTTLNVAPPGWGCAQRRPLRALTHTLLLFDPQFILIVDDDTFVNIELLKPSGKLASYIQEEMVAAPIVLGQLTMGRKVTRKGFYYGGAGYLMGRALIDRLTDYRLMGPVTDKDNYRDGGQMRELAILSQVYTLSNQSCPAAGNAMVSSSLESLTTSSWTSTEEPGRASMNMGMNMGVSESTKTLTATGVLPVDPSQQACVRIDSNSGIMADFGTSSITEVRLVELCTNLMAEENTCYHSDHSLTRCLAHGAYADIYNVPCGGAQLKDGLYVGMCMGVDECLVSTPCSQYAYPLIKSTVSGCEFDACNISSMYSILFVHIFL